MTRLMTPRMTHGLAAGLAAAVLVAALCSADTATAEDSNPLSAIGRMFGKKQTDEAQPEGDGPTTEQVLRIERLEAQIRQLTGTVEQLQYRNQQLENQVRAAGGTPSGATPGPVAAAPPPPIPPPNALTQQAARSPVQAAPLPQASPPGGRRADVFDPTVSPNAPGAPRPLGVPQHEPPPIIAAEPPPVGVPGGRGAGGPLDLSTMNGPGNEPAISPDGRLPAPPSRNPSATGAVASVAPPTETPKDTYDLAYGYVLHKDYALAEDTFQGFLKKYPTDRRAADAEFWLGESLFQRQKYDAAAQAFLDLSTKHSSHAKAPEALLRLAQSLSAMKQKEMSCATLAEVGRKYPKAPASVKQGVEREQKRGRC
jgi:tol-pal system protein YbgF